MRRRKRYFGNEQNDMQAQMVWFATGIAAVCILMILAVTVCQIGRMKRSLLETSAESPESETIVEEIPVTAMPDHKPKSRKKQERRVYTYLQGPRSWKQRIDWSGEWAEAYLDGGYFGAFGCGLCCMANIYSSQTPYQCSPLDMYEYAKEKSAYEGGMAIEWGYMRRTLSSLGFDCEVNKKPDSYRAFKNMVSEARCCIVLVSSNDSAVYWQNTPGHYVTLFLYDENKETVFLADPGDPEHNRHKIKLRTIYRSLKTASNWQCLLVGQYHKKQDTWKNKETGGNWMVPDYVK